MNPEQPIDNRKIPMLTLLQPLIAKSINRKFDDSSTILYQGEAPRNACVLVKGVVRVFSISFQGEELIVTYHLPGEFFPSSWIFGKSPTTLFFYEAVGDCEVAFMPREELISFMLADPKRLHTMLDYFTTSYTASLIRINALEQSRAREKLLQTLYFLCQRYGSEEKGRFTIGLQLTHQNLAAMVGVTRETTATELGKLKKEGVLTYKKQNYIIDATRLLELIGEESFRAVKIDSNQ